MVIKMKHLKFSKGDWICVVITLVIIEMACLWCVDISVSGLLSSMSYENVIVTNGFMSHSPMRTYHIGLWGSVLCMASLVFVVVHIIHKEEWS
jgi:hypothetical protein